MKTIELSQGKSALVDDEWFEYLSQWKWHSYKSKGGKFYARRNGKTVNGHRPQITMHKVICNVPKGMEVDHIDGDGLNNQSRNLRKATKSQNQRNTTKRSNGTSGYKGVTWHKRNKKWRAQIQDGKFQRLLGQFDDPIEAARSYDKAARKIYGKFAKTNFQEDD